MSKTPLEVGMLVRVDLSLGHSPYDRDTLDLYNGLVGTVCRVDPTFQNKGVVYIDIDWDKCMCRNNHYSRSVVPNPACFYQDTCVPIGEKIKVQIPSDSATPVFKDAYE